MSPVKFLQDQGGIEGIIQEAAKGVYSRGEKWGVGKVLRDAVQVLQSGETTPRRVPTASRWSIDDGKNIANNSADLNEKIHALEQRNKALAKLLETATAELWVQQNEFVKSKADATADAVSIAIAKVQFVQVYLENPGMPIPIENVTIQETPSNETKEESTAPPEINVTETVDEKDKPLLPSPTVKNTPENMVSGKNKMDRSSISPQNPPEPHTETSNVISSNADITHSKPVAHPSPVSFQRPRPSLAQSSFSWMLGEDQRKSSFVSASPFPSETRLARSKAEFLFGQDGEGKKSSDVHKDKSSRAKDADEEVITLHNLTSKT